MGTALTVLRYLGIIIRLLPIIEKVYAQILAVIEVNAQEGKDLPGVSKKLNVKKELLKKKNISKVMNSREIEGLIETAVGVMKAAGKEKKK